MIKISTKFKGPIWTRQGLRIMRREFGRAMTEVVTLTESEVAQGTPVGATGLLRTGITGLVLDSTKGIVKVAGPSSVYGDIVEKGRRAGRFPPVDAIALWVKRKLRPPAKELKSVSFLVARKIARQGYKGAFMFRNAERTMKRQIIARFQQAKLIIERKLGDR